MVVIPAVDLKQGHVVRLTRGDFTQKTVYSQAPEAVARKWEEEGAEMLHVVDLDGALTGRRKNIGSLKNICSNVKIPVQFGGGLRSFHAVEEVMASGVTRAVVGTKALDLRLLKRLIQAFGERIVVSLDVQSEHLQIRGWLKRVNVVQLESFCSEIESIGVRHVVFTDVARDGTLQGPNFSALERLLRRTQMNVILAGGVSSLRDIRKLMLLKYKNLFGVIIGKALYEKRMTLHDAVALTKKKQA